jgi:hypothetical protein
MKPAIIAALVAADIAAASGRLGWRRWGVASKLCLVAAGSSIVLVDGAAGFVGDVGDPVPARDVRREHYAVAGWSSKGLVFVRLLDRLKLSDSYEIAVASLDRRRRQVVRSGVADCSFEASVSPSGREIAYSDAGDYAEEYEQFVCDILVVRADGSERRNLTDTPRSLGRANQEFVPTELLVLLEPPSTNKR